MSTPFFIKQLHNKPHIALHKSLYKKELIQEAMVEEPDFIASVKTKGNYHMVELKDNSLEDSFRFLDYMVYLRRTHGG